MLRRIVAASLALALAAPSSSGSDFTAADREHWSFRPRRAVTVPAVPDLEMRRRLRTPVDAFIFRGLDEYGLRPSPPAAAEDLVRRVAFDLTGLPPSLADQMAFRESQAADPLTELVDRLLASPRYGEQWGQHWLDVVRYAESEGFEYDRAIPGVWRYRDYVVAAFNSDKPYNQFVVEQLAGDEFGGDNQQAWTAAGFHRLGPVRRNAGNAEVAFSRNEVLTQRTDIIGAAFLGVTVGCARCHDHMFDPIRQSDYYSLQAFLAGTREHEIPLAPPTEIAAHRAATARIQPQIDQLKEELEQDLTFEVESAVRAQLAELDAQLPEPLPAIATIHEADRRPPIYRLRRGDPDHPLERIQPQFLGVLLPDSAPAIASDSPQLKSQLAEWIVTPEHPLTARVIANRVWHYHFGRGLVATANDFGTNGEAPSHPELLDYLANFLVENNWSLKSLHRLILLSETYRQSSQVDGRTAAIEVDPGDELLWHFPRRRLAAHEIRDAMLAASGRLNLEMLGESVMVPVAADLVQLLYKPSQWQVAANEAQHDRRSVYLVAKRNLRLPFMEVFDQPDFQTSCAKREASTHPPQALEMLNGDLSNQLAAAFARRLEREVGGEAVQQIRRGFQLAVGRAPSDEEFTIAYQFLADYPLSEFALALFNLNAFLYVN